MMQRIPRREPIEDWEGARAFASTDLSELQDQFVTLFRHRLPHWHGARRILDLGCGAAGISVRIGRVFPRFRIDGVDASFPMLAFGEQAVAVHGLRERIRLTQLFLPSPGYRPEPYDIVISEGLLHRLADPMSLWQTIKQATRPGSGVFVMDLARPDSESRAQGLVQQHAGSENEALRKELYDSLLAAYTIEEVSAQIQAAGLGMLEVAAVGDRHLIVYGDRLYRDNPLRPLWGGAPGEE